MTVSALKRHTTALLIVLCCCAASRGQHDPRSPLRPSLRLTAPLQAPPINVPPVRLGSLSPVQSAPVMPAERPRSVRKQADSAMQYTVPKLKRQSAVYMAEPQTKRSMRPNGDPTQQQGAVTGQQPQVNAEDNLRWLKPGPGIMEAGETTARSLRQTVDTALGINRCPDCGKRRPEYNRIRISLLRIRNRILTGEGEEKVAWSPNVKPPL